MRIKETVANSGLHKMNMAQHNPLAQASLSKGLQKSSPADSDGGKVLGRQASLSVSPQAKPALDASPFAQPEKLDALDSAAKLQEMMDIRQSLLPSEKASAYETMDKLLSKTASALSDEEKSEIRGFLESGELANYLTRPLEGYDIKTLDILDSVEKFSGLTTRIKANLQSYYSGEAGNISKMERITDAVDKSGALLAANISKTVKNYTMPTYTSFDTRGFANSLDDAIAQRAQTYSSFYAETDSALSYQISEVERLMTDKTSSFFEQELSAIKVEHEQYGKISFSDIVDFTKFLSDMEKEIDEYRRDVQEKGLMGAGKTLGEIYGRHLKKAERMSDNPFAEELYQATLEKVEESIAEDLALFEEEARDMGLPENVIKELKEEFKNNILSEVGSVSERFHLENLLPDARGLAAYLKQDKEEEMAFRVSNSLRGADVNAQK